MKLVFASGNTDKFIEIKQLLGNQIQLLNLKDINCLEELPETGNTIEANAAEKAQYVFNNYKTNCFADDTGLLIDALDGDPGVFSARYAGNQCLAEDNIQKVLSKMKGKKNRQAKFITIIALIIDKQLHLFSGKIKGTITEEKRSKQGFGYDPIFIPDGYEKTFAQMDILQKNKISHRSIAAIKLANFLNQL